MKHSRSYRQQAGFTVTELMIVISIIGLLAAVSASAFNAAVAQSKMSRTKVVIAKLDQLIMERYESYKTRAVPIRIPTFIDLNNNGTQDMGELAMNPRKAAEYRLNALRDLMRMELPDRKSDVVEDPCHYMGMGTTKSMTRPSLCLAYRRKAAANCGTNWATTSWTVSSQGAECLYLIVSSMRDQDKSALDFFAESEIGDVDEDGMKEFLDAWGRPIEFLRWAPGFTQEDGALTMQSSDATKSHDPFDQMKVDSNAFALHPLIFSSGPDKEMDIFTDNLSPTLPHKYVKLMGMTRLPPDPYTNFDEGQLPGKQMDRDADGTLSYGDNITNHYQEAE